MFHAEANLIEKHLRELNKFNSSPDYGTTRVLFTLPEIEGREYVKELMREVGLDVGVDGAGNIYGTLKGEDSFLAPVWTGSHCDTVLNAGMFDGMAGVMGGIEALRQIKLSGKTHKRDISVVMYTSEEPTRFGLSCLGSRMLCGKLTAEDARALKDRDGNSLYDLLYRLGYPVSELDDGSVVKKRGDVFAAVEMHIEQSISLERNHKTIGIVKTICAPANYEIKFTGVQSHAGGTSMNDRRDAFSALCETALEAERLARESGGEYVTATVGRVSVLPAAVNVIPGFAQMSLDVRYTDTENVRDLIAGIRAKLSEIERVRGVTAEIEELNCDTPAHCDEGIRKSISDFCDEYGYSHMDCISGAYHDSLMVNSFAPVAMIFVPSKNGISHSPSEWTDFADIAAGTDILAEVLLRLADSEVTDD